MRRSSPKPSPFRERVAEGRVRALTPTLSLKGEGVAFLLLVASLSGCVTREDIRGIQTDLYTIQKGIDARLGNVKDQTESVQTSQADLLQQMNDLSAHLSSVKTDLNDYQQRIQQLSARLDDLEASLTARMDSQIELLS